MYCHDLGVMSSNPGQVELGVHSTSVLIVVFEQKVISSCSKLQIFLKCTFLKCFFFANDDKGIHLCISLYVYETKSTHIQYETDSYQSEIPLNTGSHNGVILKS